MYFSFTHLIDMTPFSFVDIVISYFLSLHVIFLYVTKKCHYSKKFINIFQYNFH
jgi:hypothetical protein